MKKPNVYIIAGANGAGKTTFATQYLPSHAKCRHFVNADLIARGIEPFAPQSASIKAGRIMLEQLRALANQGVDFAFESTLAGRTYLSFLKGLKAKGYTVHIFFLWTPTVNLSLSRIKERVAQGGHHIPPQDVRRRFKKSLVNFLDGYRELADYWHMVDNSQMSPRRIASAGGGKIEIRDQELFEHIMKERI